MTCKRVIPCLDTVNGRVVKGINFVDLKDTGDPVEMAAVYDKAGADEIVFLDITATTEERPTMREVAARTSSQCNVPFIVGGGMRTLDEVGAMFEAGADKVSLNTAAVNSPKLITQVSTQHGRDRLVVAIDARKTPGAPSDRWEVMIRGGKTSAGIDVVQWAREVERLGAGEILLTSMDCDGVCDGYDLALTRAVAHAVEIPVVASGGAGKPEHFVEAIVEAQADAVLAASVFHFGILSIAEVKRAMAAAGIVVCLPAD